MWTQKNVCRFHKGFLIQLCRYPPRKPFTDWVSYWLAKQPVTIRSREGIESRVEIVANNTDCIYSGILRQFRIQRMDEVSIRVEPVQVDRGNLPCRVNTGVRPAGKEDRSS